MHSTRAWKRCASRSRLASLARHGSLTSLSSSPAALTLSTSRSTSRISASRSRRSRLGPSSSSTSPSATSTSRQARPRSPPRPRFPSLSRRSSSPARPSPFLSTITCRRTPSTYPATRPSRSRRPPRTRRSALLAKHLDPTCATSSSASRSSTRPSAPSQSGSTRARRP